MFTVEDIQHKLQSIHEPSRIADALVIALFMGRLVPNRDTMWSLKDKPSQPLCMITTEAAGARIRADRERDDVIHFRHGDEWLLFVERCVPKLTSNLGDAIAFGDRIFKGWAWAINNEGDAVLEVGQK